MSIHNVKYFLILILFGGTLVTLPVCLQAQIRVGPKLGFQVGRAMFADEEYRQEFTSGFMPGPQAGVVMNYRVNSFYSLHTELYYSQKGKRSIAKAEDLAGIKNRAVYDYLDLPVLLRLSKHKNYKKYKLEYYLNVGPAINYWLGGRGTLVNPELYEYYDSYEAHYKIQFDKPVERYGENLYVTDPNRLQMSLDFGGGLIFDLGTGQAIMVDLRNSFGIGKTYMGRRNSGDYGLHSYNDNFEAVNHVMGLSVAYLLDIDMKALIQKGRTRR